MQNETLLSTYGLLGIPDALAVTFALISLSLTLVPWLGGKDIGPLKIPNLEGLSKRLIIAIGPLTLVLFMIGFYPLWSTAPQPGKALRLALQAPTQIGDLLEAAPSLDGERIYCGSAKVNLILAHKTKTPIPIVVHSLTIRSKTISKSDIVGKCKIDPLSYRPYGIAAIDTYVVNFDESSIDVTFIENKDSALKSTWENILYRDNKQFSVYLKNNEEPYLFNLELNTENKEPIAIWIEAKFDESGEFVTQTDKIVLWR